MCDLMVALDAVRQEVPRVVLRRPLHYLRPIAENQDDSIYRRLLRDDTVETALLRDAVACYPGRWCRWGDELAPGWTAA
jgi:hypothetical protein